jgi:4-nitrophenyl phosphatase
MNNIKTILLDMDGVLWRGGEPLVNLPQLFERIKTKGIRAICVTNNSVKTVQFYLERLSEIGLMLDEDQIITSAEGTAAYLADKFPARGPIYVVGEEGLVETLRSYQFQVLDQPENHDFIAVVAGLDRRLTYQKIDQAARLVNKGALFIGTNPDQSIPIPGGLAPGAGTVIGAIEIASQQKALIIGKPQPALFELALRRSNSKPDQTIMIGDRLNTDIEGAQKLGIKTALVLSGVTGVQQAQVWTPAPDIIAENVSIVVEQINYEKS